MYCGTGGHAVNTRTIFKSTLGKLWVGVAPGNEEGWKFPDVKTPIEGYYRCDDLTTSGIGVPA